MNFIQQGYKGNYDWIYWVASIFIVFIGWQLVGILPLVKVAFNHTGSYASFLEASADGFMNIGIDKNLYFFLMILTFVFGLLFLLLAVKYVHKRSLTSLITSRENIDWKRFFYGFFIWGLISVLYIGIEIGVSPAQYSWNFQPLPFFTLLAISILFLPFQTSFEELLFRGYFMQGIGILAKNRWLPLLLTSLVFGLLHGANPEVERLGNIVFVFYIGTGLFYGVITLMDESNELALGLHAANNIVAALLVTTDWMAFQTDALFIDTSEPSVTLDTFLPVFLFYPLLLLLFSKKYGWTQWRKKLTGPIEVPNS